MLLSAVQSVLLLAVIAVALPIGVLAVECVIAAVWPAVRTSTPVLSANTKVAVLMPAHNESGTITPVLQGIQQQLRPQDLLLVIADNCTDDTAAVARATGAQVLERQDTQRRGKGYALDFGIRALAADAPDVVVMMDADCLITGGSLLTLAAQALATDRPVQSRYLFAVPAEPSTKALISAFAITVKNWVRPLGMRQLGLPSLLFGTGMAFPWSVLTTVDLASGHIVEDMKLGFDLAIAGHPPLFAPEVQVMGQLPDNTQAATSQRTRWEHGHLSVLRDYVPQLLGQSLKQRRLDLLALALDLAVPPLTLLVMLWTLTIGLTGLAAVVGLGTLPILVAAMAGGILLIAIASAWLRFARQDIPLSSLLTFAGYLLWKIPLYFKFLVKPQSEWVRTERSQGKSPVQK
ncbi:glycosyltransferase family 2 protein [Leptolyngbya iicbica]|uniref:Glycosyltransferase n=2 Tax=Cyanophyceae TaxID=3028117 RepID=A0A4Q7EGL0_9CYAN|nr:glycosyltransferase family 2 protein [Leptolyngbya sp. LK]RZM82196.1 glycosyltransferase [Leptolyngbya sp. LK]